MGKYSILSDINADISFENVLNEILDVIFTRVNKNDIKAILIIGGYGRGEGGIYFVNGNYRFVNDIDFLIIPRKNKSVILKNIPSIMNDLIQNRFYERTGLKQVDFSLLSVNSLLFAPNLISYYEIREGSKVVFGSFDLKRAIRKLNPHHLTLYDGANLFYNRGYGLLIAAFTLMNKLEVNEKFKKNILIELQKACIAIGDCLLLMNTAYHYSYRQRLKNFNEIIIKAKFELKDKIDIVRIKQMYTWAIEGKLNPTDKMFNNDYSTEWFVIRDIFLNFFLLFESIRLKCSFENWHEYSNYIYENGFHDPLYIRARRMLKSLVWRKYKIDIPLNNYYFKVAILPHLLLSFSGNFSFDKNFYIDLPEEKYLRQLCPASEYPNDVIGKILLSYHADGIISELIRKSER